MAGWIKLYRTIQTHWIFEDAEKFKAWNIILFTVNFEPKKVNIKNSLYECCRGESLLSLDSWAKKFGNNWDKSKVRRFFKLLENDSMIIIKSEHKTTRLSVCNYDAYQDERHGDETQTKRKRNANETQMTPTKEGKEIKEGKEGKENTIVEYDYSTEKEILNSIANLFDSKYYASDKQKQKWRDEIRKLIHIDKEDKQTIIDVITFARKDEFWSSNLLSISSIRKKTNDVTKFDQIKSRLRTNTATKSAFDNF